MAIYGTGEPAELAYLSLKELGLEAVAVFDGGAGGEFLGMPVRPSTDHTSVTCDLMIVASWTAQGRLSPILSRRECLRRNSARCSRRCLGVPGAVGDATQRPGQAASEEETEGRVGPGSGMMGQQTHIGRHETDDLLLSGRVSGISYEPFFFFQVQDYLPRTMFEELRASFPLPAHFRAAEGGKQYLSSNKSPNDFERFCAANELWRQLFEFFGSAYFMADLHNVIKRGLLDDRGWRGRKKWCAPSRMTSLFPLEHAFQPVQTTYQF